jgi:hypothetical protein
MTIANPARRSPPTPGQIAVEQRQQAEKEYAGRKAALPAKATVDTAVTIPDNRTPEQKYIDEIAPSSIAGKLIKFSKEGEFVVAETDEELSADDDYIALCDETLIGWIRFRDDAPPDRYQGLLYDNFIMPERRALGDNDPNEWPLGLNQQPADPWQHQVCLVLQSPKTQELFTFATSSQTGRRAVGNLLRHYDRMRRTDKDSYPVVRLKPSGFVHRDERVGWVPVPAFAVVGHTPKSSAAVPDTSLSADLNDELPI